MGFSHSHKKNKKHLLAQQQNKRKNSSSHSSKTVFSSFVLLTKDAKFYSAKKLFFISNLWFLEEFDYNYLHLTKSIYYIFVTLI
jgi:hypothetical protein